MAINSAEDFNAALDKAVQDSGGMGYQMFPTANKILDDLQKRVQSGDLSQSEFLNITSEPLKRVDDFLNLAYQTSSQAITAAQSSGSEDYRNKRQAYDIYSSAQELLGRDLTPQEFAQLKPRFGANLDEGRAYVAELASQEARTPGALAKKAPQYSGEVGSIFQDLLKRGASQDELDYFGSLLASGETTPYELRSFVQNLPEYRTQQDTAFREKLSGELGDIESKAFAREQENILSRFAKAGTLGSSALDYAVTDALAKLAENRTGFLAGLSAEQYGGQTKAAREDYLGQLNRLYGKQDYSTQRSDAYLDYLTKRIDESKDYERQMKDYLTYLNSQPKSKYDWLNTAVGGIRAAGSLKDMFTLNPSQASMLAGGV